MIQGEIEREIVHDGMRVKRCVKPKGRTLIDLVVGGWIVDLHQRNA